MYNVILVDDEDWSLKVSRKMFHWEEYGFEIILSTTKQAKALEYLETEKVDVVLLDMCMPGLSGEQMMNEIRKRNKNVKIVVLSGYSSFSYAQSAIDHNVFSYCLKPISEDKAQDVITRLKETLDHENPDIEHNLPKKVDIENYKFDKLIKYIDHHCNEKLYLNDLVKKFDINLTYCCHLFKKHFNMSFNEYVTNLKMSKAAGLIQNGNMEIDEIADYLNYEYVYFCKLFKKHFDKTPRQYRIEYINKR